MDKPQMIINIGRQVGSGGRMIAKQLAEEFECSLYDKELLNLAAKESGFSEKFFEENDEQNGFLKSLSHVHVPLFGENYYYKNNFSQENLYQFQSDAIRKAAGLGSCVFVGRTADYVLRDFKNTVNIFISADLEDRIRRVCKRRDIVRGEAKKLIKRKEDERASYYNYYTGKQWGHAESYDLCVNTSRLGIEGTGCFIASFIRLRFGLTPGEAHIHVSER